MKRLFFALLASLCLALYLALAVAVSVVTPFNKGNDEGNNLRYLEFILAKGRLPVTVEERAEVGPEGNWPALYHLILVGPSRWLNIEVDQPPALKIYWDSFRYRALDLGSEEEVWYLLTEDFEWPYFGRILALHLGRWLSILFSLINLLLIYRVVLELLPERRWLALFGVCLLGFMPAYLFIASVLNEDSLVAALGTLYFWALIRLVKEPRHWWPYPVMGLTLGLSVTAKYTTAIFPFEVLVVLAVVARRHGWTWRWWGQRVAVVGGCAILASSWWFGWSIWHLNRIAELGLIPGVASALFGGGTDETLAAVGQVLSGGQLDQVEPVKISDGTLTGWARLTFMTFWGVSIDHQVPGAPYVFGLIGLALAVTGWGLWQLWRLDPARRQWLWLMAFHVSIVFIFPLIDFFANRRLGKTAQGRHIFIPAAAALVLLAVWGLSTALPVRYQRWVLPLIVIGLVGWAGVHIYRLDTFQPDPLPIRTVAQAAGWLAHPAEAAFGESVALTGYSLETQPETGQLRLDLAWRALALSRESYLLRIRLLDAGGEAVSHWMGYHGNSRVPTLAWQPGDVIFDRLVLPLPALPAGDYSIQIQLLSQAGPLPLAGAEDTGLDLAAFTLDQPTTLPLPNSVVFGEDELVSPVEARYALWRSQGPVEVGSEATALPRYRYPATISFITSPDIEIELIDPAGQAWPPSDPTGTVSTFVIGPRWPSGPYQARLALAGDSGPAAETVTAALLTVENWRERRFEVPPMEQALTANFADQLRLLGYDLPQTRVKAGDAFPLTLYWQALPDRSPQAEFIQFNHLLDQTGRKWGGYDRQPLEYYNTLLWAPGEVVVDGYAVPVDPGAPPGDYYLNVGYYLVVGESAVNLPLIVDGQPTGQASVAIGPIHVTAP